MKTRLFVSMFGVALFTALACWATWYVVDGLRKPAGIQASTPAQSSPSPAPGGSAPADKHQNRPPPTH